MAEFVKKEYGKKKVEVSTFRIIFKHPLMLVSPILFTAWLLVNTFRYQRSQQLVTSKVI